MSRTSTLGSSLYLPPPPALEMCSFIRPSGFVDRHSGLRVGRFIGCPAVLTPPFADEQTSPLGVGELGTFSFLAPRGWRTASLLPAPNPNPQVPSRSLVKIASQRSKSARVLSAGTSLARGPEETAVRLLCVQLELHLLPRHTSLVTKK